MSNPTMGEVKLPAASSLVVFGQNMALLSSSGEIESLTLKQASKQLPRNAAVICCHAPSIRHRLDRPDLHCLDLLELFVFAKPTSPCVPSVLGLIEALSLPAVAASDLSGLAISQVLIAESLLDWLRLEADPEAALLAKSMATAGWSWGEAVESALLGVTSTKKLSGYQVWRSLPDLYSEPPPPPPRQQPVTEAAARLRLAKVLGEGSETRASQADYAAALTWAFAPRAEPDNPNLVLAEAGTGVGKTLGYLVPAQLWARQNQDRVWISTYTRNLQNQIVQELERLYPDATERNKKTVVRRGRENYLCLLNYEEAQRLTGLLPQAAIGLGLLARWLMRTNDGDLRGADFPQFLSQLVGREWSQDLSDRRGECIHGACSHYNKCFIERSIRKAQQAEVVIANHALVLFNLSCIDGPSPSPPTMISGDGTENSPAVEVAADPTGSSYIVLPQRLVFDEGHHIFAAADSVFATEFSARSGAELRQWLLGNDSNNNRGGGLTGSLRRAHGLALRVEPLLAAEDMASRELVQTILKAARVLPRTGAAELLGKGRGLGAIEELLAMVRLQTLQQAEGSSEEFGIEATKFPPIDGLARAARGAEMALESIAAPLERLRQILLDRLLREAETLESSERGQIEALTRSLDYRAIAPLRSWQAILKDIEKPTPDEYVDWLEIHRSGGFERNIALKRHWLDPTLPLAKLLRAATAGVVVTSATLTDQNSAAADPLSPSVADNRAEEWQRAEINLGVRHFSAAPFRVSVASPFDYPSRTKVFIVGDVNRDRPADVAAAYLALFKAAGGGGLGLFTAIERLKQTHAHLAPKMAELGMTLLAQHIDTMEVNGLITIFRSEIDSCLLGTDALRDGVDVPGRSLRLIVFDRVPWTRPTILHRERRRQFGAILGESNYDHAQARLKLKQAFGRLIRRQDDRGVFVMLDRATPTKLLTAFPSGVAVVRCGLAEAVRGTEAFLREWAL
ncbi:MAG: ATP-dependent DNA helicase [Candidatus Pacebacteria bacterium]|nr:ATP-dependent DNA helicase [Candidatus Paceibacterota bacterium]